MSARVRSLLAALALSATAALAANYPERPVRLIVPFAPGGATDIISRHISQRMGEVLGVQILVENRAGGAANIGTELAARAAPDGHTLLFASISNSVNAALFPKLRFDIQKDFAPVSLFATVPLMLAVHPAFPAQSVQELIALAKAPGKRLNYGSGGIGTANHVAGELFKQLANVEIDHIPYKGGGPALADLAGGHLNMVFTTMTSTQEMVKSGRLRALATTGATRSPGAPDLPTMIEAGVAGYEVTAWYVLLAPAGTPPPVITRLSTELARIARAPEVVASLRAQGTQTIGSTPDEFAAFLRAEIEKWAMLAKATGLRAE